MYKLCKTEQSARRQRQMEQGLLKAMEQRQYEDISISELCEHMGVPRKSFYRYFSSKDGALYALIDHTLIEFESFEIAYCGHEKRLLQKDLERFFRFWKHHRALITVLEKNGLAGVLVQRSIDYTLADVVFPGRFMPGDSRRTQGYVVRFSVCGLLAMVLQWHQEGYVSTVQELAVIAVRLLTQPLFPDADTRI